MVRNKSAEKNEQQARRTSILGATLPGLPKMLQTGGSRDSLSSAGGFGLSSRLGGGADMQEMRELKLKLARKENELKHCQQALAESK